MVLISVKNTVVEMKNIPVCSINIPKFNSKIFLDIPERLRVLREMEFVMQYVIDRHLTSNYLNNPKNYKYANYSRI